MTQRLPRGRGGREGGETQYPWVPEKCRSAISQKKPDARKPLFSDNSCYIQPVSSQNWMFQRCASYANPSPPLSILSVSLSLSPADDASTYRRFDPPPPPLRFYYRIFVTAITMPSRARGRENNRDASRTGRRVDIEFIRLRES